MKFGLPFRPSYSAVYYFRSLHSINLFPLTQMWQFWLTACATWIALFFRSFIDTLWLVLVRNSYSTPLVGYEMIIANSCERVLKKSCLITLAKKKKLVSVLLMVIAFSKGITILWIGGNSIAWPPNLKKSGECRPSRALLRRSVTRLRVILILPGNFKS